MKVNKGFVLEQESLNKFNELKILYKMELKKKYKVKTEISNSHLLEILIEESFNRLNTKKEFEFPRMETRKHF
jgi:hypothetical protein